jgi:hypothetical protein
VLAFRVKPGLAERGSDGEGHLTQQVTPVAPESVTDLPLVVEDFRGPGHELPPSRRWPARTELDETGEGPASVEEPRRVELALEIVALAAAPTGTTSSTFRATTTRPLRPDESLPPRLVHYQRFPACSTARMLHPEVVAPSGFDRRAHEVERTNAYRRDQEHARRHGD